MKKVEIFNLTKKNKNILLYLGKNSELEILKLKLCFKLTTVYQESFLLSSSFGECYSQHMEALTLH